MSNFIGHRLSRGDRVPTILGFSATGQLYASEEQAGRALVAVLARNLDAPGLVPLLAAFSQRADEFAALDVDLVSLIDEDLDLVFEYSLCNPGRVSLVGSLNGFLDRIGFSSLLPEVVVIDRNLRVAGCVGPGAADRMVADAMASASRLPRESKRDICLPAPVLILPNLLDEELCRELVGIHRAHPALQSPAEYTDSRKRSRSLVNHSLKKRHDCLLGRDHPMHARLTQIMRQRCFPEIARVFQTEVSHTESFNVCCYPRDGGFFRRHRGNRQELVAFRKFSVSINLGPDAGDRDGGCLRFPEFNDHDYRCPVGAGLVFSAGLLHEVTPARQGDCYSLVTHLHDEQGEARRLAMSGEADAVGALYSVSALPGLSDSTMLH